MVAIAAHVPSRGTGSFCTTENEEAVANQGDMAIDDAVVDHHHVPVKQTPNEVERRRSMRIICTELHRTQKSLLDPPGLLHRATDRPTDRPDNCRSWIPVREEWTDRDGWNRRCWVWFILEQPDHDRSSTTAEALDGTQSSDSDTSGLLPGRGIRQAARFTTLDDINQRLFRSASQIHPWSGANAEAANGDA